MSQQNGAIKLLANTKHSVVTIYDMNIRLRNIYLANLCAENEVIVPEVPDPEDEAELLVSERDHSVVTEDDRLLSQLGSRELREDKTDHEGLNETTDNRLKWIF